MEIVLNDKMIVGILSAWASRNLGGEGFVVESYEFREKGLTIKMKAEEVEEE
jgi:hypothetical protein